MKLIRSPDLPAELAGRYESVAARLADLDVVLPSALETNLAKVMLASDFVLRVMLRWPELLVERLSDAEPLDRAAVTERLQLDGLAEPQVMTALRRIRQVEMARLGKTVEL